MQIRLGNDWHKVLRKIKASGELWGHFTGEIDTKEKFEKHRMALAQNEWRQMKATDSRECRNCHSFTAMEKQKQRPKAQQMHAQAQQQGKTCIDCHKGIAHLLPDDYDESVDYTAGIVTTPATTGNDALEREAQKAAPAPAASAPPAGAPVPSPAGAAPSAPTSSSGSPVSPTPPAASAQAPDSSRGDSAKTGQPAPR
jgi:hypothetical protein